VADIIKLPLVGERFVSFQDCICGIKTGLVHASVFMCGFLFVMWQETVEKKLSQMILDKTLHGNY